MDTLNTSLQGATVRAWEESIWLDRREDRRLLAPSCGGRLVRFRNWVRSFSARTQLGPLPDEGEWLLGDPEKRF